MTEQWVSLLWNFIKKALEDVLSWQLFISTKTLVMALFVLDTQILVIFDPTFELIVYRTSKIFTETSSYLQVRHQY